MEKVEQWKQRKKNGSLPIAYLVQLVATLFRQCQPMGITQTTCTIEKGRVMGKQAQTKMAKFYRKAGSKQNGPPSRKRITCGHI